MLKKVVFSFLILLVAFSSQAQMSRLANQYYQNGEYEKAAELYEKIVTSGQKNSDSYVLRLIDCLITLKEYDKGESILKKRISEKPNDVQNYVTLGNLYERKGDGDASEKQYNKAIHSLENNHSRSAIYNLARAFTSLAMFKKAIEVYELGGNYLKDKSIYASNLANLYKRIGNEKKMAENYLISAPKYASNSKHLIEQFEKNLSHESYDDLQAQLYSFIQEFPDENIYPEILQWSFIHLKEYKKALRQARALDRKNDENGARVYDVGIIAYQDEDYDTAIKAFSYIVENKSINSSYFLDAQRALLSSKRSKITQRFDYTEADLRSLDREYKSFISTFGQNTQTARLMMEYSEFQALYLNNLDSARIILDKVITFGGLEKQTVAEAKLKLGDYYLMDGERWEASLLFSQVDKDFKEGKLGEEARYRNARLSYFMGDFEWAQEQFDILKSATTRLISNDAIDMSVFIMDNLNLDTTAVPMELYAKAELLIFQNKFDEAEAKWDSILQLFPEHSLMDDILYSKAQMYKKLLKPDLAIKYYNEIIEDYPEEIRCDNAIYELAKMYDFQLDDKVKAKDLYEKIFMEYESSTFAIEARKRFRVLRNESI